MYCYISIDLHVLGTPPAFILSQDQTLKIYIFLFVSFVSWPSISGFYFLLKFYWRCLFIFLLSFQRSVAASLSPRDSLFIITYLLLSCQLLFLTFLNIFLNIFLVFFSFFRWLYLFNHIVLPLSTVFLSFFIFLFVSFLSFLLLSLCAHVWVCLFYFFIQIITKYIQKLLIIFLLMIFFISSLNFF